MLEIGELRASRALGPLETGNAAPARYEPMVSAGFAL
jgi:hypothetical protein